jgi:hypothetical protein
VRIWKLYGTRPRKGPPTAERPHRWTRLVEGPAWEAEAARANTALLPRLLEMWSWVEDRRRGRPETTAATYAAAALKQESEAVAGARPGGRNNRLNEAALKVGELVGAGSLDYEAAARCLYDAACRCGLDKDTGCGPDGIKATIRSGLAAGLKHPRDLSRVNGAAHANGTPRPNADTSDDPLDLDATAADLIQANVTVRWGWERWLPYGVLTVLASEPGVGKTRFCADLARRVYLGLPWPDGALPTFPRESRTLWVPADSQHAELATLTQSFGFPPEALYLNATRRNPFEGTMLDDPADLTDFEARIKRVRPALVFVDTSLNATDRSAHKPEDAKAFFVPLAKVAHRTGVVMLLVTHLNAAGKPLGRRIMGQARLVMQLEHPDPDKQPNRRKLYVVKSNSIFPPALGVTMADQGNEYDDKPPTGPEEVRRKPGPKPEAVLKLAEWLAGCLKDGPKKVHELRKSAEQAGHSAATLYAAKEHLELEQFEAEGKKWWKLTHDDQSP